MFEICCKKLNYITKKYNIKTYVLIYEKELIEIAEKFTNITIIKRDKETCDAEGPLHFIYKDILNTKHKYLMFLNPCLIFLSPDTIIKSIKDFLESKKDYGTSVKIFKNWLWNSDGKIITNIDYKRLTTKEIEPLYQCAHCFHIFNRENFLKDGYMLKKDIKLLPINEIESIDIDTKEDYEYAKWKWEINF